MRAAILFYSKRRWIISLVLSALVIVSVLAAAMGWFPIVSMRSEVIASTTHASTDDVPPEAIHVEVFEVGSLQPPPSSTRYRGTVQSRRESRLAFRRGGRVVEVFVDEGDSIQTGKCLARLDDSDLRADREQLCAARDLAQAQLDEALAGPRSQTIDAAEAELKRLKADRDLAKARANRESMLRQRGAGSDQSFDDANFALQIADASVATAEARLDELREGTREEQIAASRAALAGAEAELKRNEVDFRDSQILAPFDGAVTARMVDEGSVVGPDGMVLEVMEAPPLEARFGVPQAVAGRLDQGDLVEVFTREADDSSAGDILSATVVRIHPNIDRRTRTRAVDVRFPVDAPVVPGQTVTLAMTDRRDTTGTAQFWTNTSALVRGSRGLWSLMVVNPQRSVGDSTLGTTQRRDVRVVKTVGAMTLVEGMIEAGDLAVRVGTHRIGPGVLVLARADPTGASEGGP